jgi:hypothetical protein
MIITPALLQWWNFFFSQADKNTTSEVETEATDIVLGMTYNNNVALEKTKDMYMDPPPGKLD